METQPSSKLDRISLGKLIGDVPHAIFHVDRGLFFNLIQLTKRPAASIEDYLSGNRKQFFHPASYLVLALLCNYLVVKLINLHFYDAEELKLMDPLATKAIMAYDAMQWWILIAIPVCTLFLYLIFHIAGKAFNIGESAVVILFTIAQGVFIQTFIYLCVGWVHDGSFRRTMETVNMSILILYAAMVTYQLLNTISNKVIRSIISLFTGAGLAALWIASAYLLYLILGH
jgi:hypothetical protein